MTTTSGTPLCQTERGSCAACCGVDNFRDRSDAARDARLRRRTEAWRAAWPDEAKLARARDAILDEERSAILFPTVRTCPFAGFLDDRVEDGRVGCLLHPTRHPSGADLRDLGVYDRKVCAEHLCAPHEWLRPVERAVAQCVEGLLYGRVVTDAGLVKAIVKLVEEERGRALAVVDVERARDAFAALFDALATWPFRDPDPRRFGGFLVVGDDAVERTITSSCTVATGAMRSVLDALGSTFSTREDEERAVATVRAGVRACAQAIVGRPLAVVE